MKNSCLIRSHSSHIVLQRRLTLDDFPMEHSFADVQHRRLETRDQKNRFVQQLAAERAESGNLREYSRDRFLSAVVRDATFTQQRRVQQLRQIPTLPRQRGQSRPNTVPEFRSRVPKPPTTPTNGPTRDGSILYNNTPFLLNSIRTRPQSEVVPSRFDHLRGANIHYPEIQEILAKSNQEYRVISASTRQGYVTYSLTSPDYCHLVEVSKVNVLDTSSLSRKSVYKAWEVQDPFAEVQETKSVIELDTYPVLDSRRSSNIGIRTSSDELNLLPEGEARLQKVSALSEKPANSVTRISSVISNKSLTHGVTQRCWVDDITISSNGSDTDEPPVTPEAGLEHKMSVDAGHARNLGQGNKIITGPKNKNAPPRVGSPKHFENVRTTTSVLAHQGPAAPSPAKEIAGAAESEHQPQISSTSVPEETELEEEEEEPEPILPRFLCPSSERKSKQVAIKEWLAKTSFATACRTVPIM